MFTSSDLVQIRQKGIGITLIEKQINYFVQGFPFIKLVRPALLSDGISSFDERQRLHLVEIFDQLLPGLRVVKFVPASGAASRMFKTLFEYKEKSNSGVTSLPEAEYFFSHIKEIAFYEDLVIKIRSDGSDPEKVLASLHHNELIDYILSENGLNYSNLPKGLIKFHSYPEGARTSVEEHMVEAAVYARDGTNSARLHFTISPEHSEKFLQLIASVRKIYERKLNIAFDISFSIQKTSTDIIAVDDDNQPFRDEDGNLVFRPGGHGALLSNLEEIDADVIFIKNIDNIVPDRLKGPTFEFKKLLGGFLLSLKQRIDKYLEELSSPSGSSPDIQEMAAFAAEELHLTLPENFNFVGVDEQSAMIFQMLNRPIRVCGMVKNEGEPGGGPFWVSAMNGVQSLQIVESSQINLNDIDQKKIFSRSTHFNPVDLVCCTRDFTGKKFRLSDFVDENTGFISKKPSGKRTVKAQELPGLWNGAMAGWITLFMEVPIITFNPVKTVNDLLRKEHLPL
ncbi:MAG: DUF4301 family protein [Bacteroidota bacterium]